MLKPYRHIQIITLVLASILYLDSIALSQSKANPQKKDLFYVKRVIDGDTLKLSNGQRVRLIGVDTPEMHHSNKLLNDSKRSRKDTRAIQELGRRSAEFTRSLCLSKKVRLEYDLEKKDKYGRLLAYVYLEDGRFVNAKILEEGYGQVMTIPPNVKYADYFLRLQKEARQNNRGLWKENVNYKGGLVWKRRR